MSLYREKVNQFSCFDVTIPYVNLYSFYITLSHNMENASCVLLLLNQRLPIHSNMYYTKDI